MSRGKYDAEVNLRLRVTVYAEDKEEARTAAYRVVHKLIESTGAGDGTVTGLFVRRIGSARDEHPPFKRVRR
ncbi:hypothetical protein LCGC14_2019940 [marine sediment metagenome]|uniref:Uncharacterized protein n=1 Tax=marine sediment metagenome TaxID=412755 RepID=A0A0F9EY26_9ZZZZ